MSIFPKFFFTLFGNALPSWLRSYIARVDGDGGTIVDTGHTKEVYADVIDYNPLLIQTCDGGSADDLYSLFAFDDIDDLQLRVVADGGTNVDIRQNALVAQHLWRNDLHNNASLIVPCASNKAGRLYAYQPTVEPNTTLLDYYTGAAAAYSLRSLSTYTTNVVKVRRSGDDVELDFTASEVSGGTLAAWVVAGGGTEDGFVTTWYDQSGNANNATQATAANQPKIVSSGTLVTENGRAAVEFDGTDDRLTMGLISNSTEVSIAAVHKNPHRADYDPIIGVGNSNGYALTTQNNKYNLFYRGIADQATTTDAPNDIQALVFAYTKSANSQVLHSNGQQIQNITPATMVTPTTGSSIGAYDVGGSPTKYDGLIQEIILYASDQSANRTGIEGNINDYYNIYP